MANSLNPQKGTAKFSPLETLALQALRDFGDFSAERASGETMLMMVQHANQVIEDIVSHAYWTGGAVAYYEALADIRQIPDLIVQRGLLAYFAQQQGSERMNSLLGNYFRTMNVVLYNRMTGGSVPLSMAVVDKDENGYTGGRNGD